MKKLEKTFIKSGFRHELVQRKDNIAIYKRTLLGLNRSHYEVVMISSHNGYTLGKSYIKAAETYPGNSMWGVQGWTHTTIDTAKDRFNKLVKKAGRKKLAAA